MDAAEALRLQRRALEAFIRMTAATSPGGLVIEEGGVIAAVTPACRHRSLANSALHRGTDGLEAALPQLADAYEEHGIVAAAMWSIEPDPDADAALETAGYAFDGAPAAMAMELSGLPRADLGDLDWDASADPGELGRVNDLAYGYPQGQGLSGVIGAPPAGYSVRSYRARVGGETASVLQTVDVGDDCLIVWVATLSEHRGKALATRLLHAALAEAAERGLRTTSLQASMLGRGVYQRLGYEAIAPLRLHERRSQ